MKLIEKTLPADHDLVLFGDIHKGNILEHFDGVHKCKEFILSKRNRFACFMGDGMEAILTDDYRYDPITIATPPLAQMRDLEATLRPIKERILVYLQGNHERKLLKFGDLAEDTAATLGVEYGTYSSVLSIRDKLGLMYKIFLTHGAGTINSTLDVPSDRLHSMHRSLRRRLMRKAGDCAVMAMGHTHKLLATRPINELYLTSAKKIKQHYVKPHPKQEWIPTEQRWYVNTGAFLKLYGEGVSGYAEVAGYDPIELGFAVVEVRDRMVQGVRLEVIK